MNEHGSQLIHGFCVPFPEIFELLLQFGSGSALLLELRDNKTLFGVEASNQIRCDAYQLRLLREELGRCTESWSKRCMLGKSQ